MVKSLALITVLATAAAANAQIAEPAPAETAPSQSQPAPIVRAYQNNPAPAPQLNQGPWSGQPNQPPPPPGTRGPVARRGRQQEPQSQIVDSQPVAGVWLRSNQASVMRTISATPRGTEIRLERGVLNVSVHHPAEHSEILVDLPGGQASLLKDGLYTFNADTNTVRVLHGEIAAYPGPIAGPTDVSGTVKKVEKPLKVKEAHQLAFNGDGDQVKPVEAYPYEMTADLLPVGNVGGRGYANYSGEDGPYAYPYYAGGWDYPYGYGYPYGGYPFGYGIGIGYYGGFHGGYRSGFRR